MNTTNLALLYQSFIVALSIPSGIKISITSSQMLRDMLENNAFSHIKVISSDLAQISNGEGCNDCACKLWVLDASAVGKGIRLLLAFDSRLAFTNTIAAWRVSGVGIMRRTSEEAIQAAYVLVGGPTHWMAGIRFWVAPTGMLMATGGTSREMDCKYEVVERHNYELFSKKAEEVNI